MSLGILHLFRSEGSLNCSEPDKHKYQILLFFKKFAFDFFVFDLLICYCGEMSQCLNDHKSLNCHKCSNCCKCSNGCKCLNCRRCLNCRCKCKNIEPFLDIPVKNLVKEAHSTMQFFESFFLFDNKLYSIFAPDQIFLCLSITCVKK